MTGIRRVSQLGTTGESTYVDGSIQAADIADGAIVTVDIAANAVTQAKLSTDIPLSGMRNFVTNGNMRIAQRTTSQASITSGTYWTVDRYRTNYSGAAGTWTQTQSTDGPAGFGNSLKMECTPTAKTPLDANSELAIVQRFEGQNLQSIAKGTVSAKPLMVSFWVKSNKTGTYICELYDYDNSRNCSRSYSITAAGTWQYVTIAFPSDTTGAFTNDENLSLHICWFLATGSNFTTGTLQTEWGTAVTANRAVGQTNLADTVGNYWQVTGVQLEEGTQPTPFEQRPIGVELALCQRYYWRSTSGLTTDGNSRHAHFRRLNAYQMIATGHCAFPVPMRAEPSVSLYNGNGIGYVDAYGAGQEGYVIASAEGLSTFGLGMIVKYTNSGLGTTANFAGDPASYSYWMNIEASAEL